MKRYVVLAGLLIVGVFAGSASAVTPLTTAQLQSGTVQLTTNSSFNHSTFMQIKRRQFYPSMWGAARLQYWGTTDYYRFDWAENGCSVPSSPVFTATFAVHGAIINSYFNEQCQRHDFCYRNTKRFFASSAFDTHKTRCDNTFNTDMALRCDRFNVVARVACDTYRGITIGAVRALGGLFT